MLTIDRQQFGTATTYFIHKQLTGHYQCFLISQQHTLTGTGRRQGRQQSGSANDSGHDVLNLRQGCNQLQAGRSRQYLGGAAGLL